MLALQGSLVSLSGGNLGYKMASVGRPEDGAPKVHDSGGPCAVEDYEIPGGQKPFIPILEADNIPPELVSRTANATDDRVESRTIAPAG